MTEKRPRTPLPARDHAGALIAGFGLLIVAVAGWYLWDAFRDLGTGALLAILGLGIGVGLVIAASVLAHYAPNALNEQARHLASQLDSAGRGDLRGEGTAAVTHGALAALGEATHRALARLRQWLVAARTQSTDAAARAEDLASQASAAHIAAQRSAEGTAFVAQHAAQLSDQLATVHQQASEHAEHVERLSGLARHQRSALDRVASASAELQRDLHAARQELHGIESQHLTAEQRNTEVATAVAEVREFVGLVRKMARQSKLLSLNAAMEAARAGEQGSGFAVVASEVRRLARSSSEAADRTEALLTALLTKSQTAQVVQLQSASLLRQLDDEMARAADALVSAVTENDAPAGIREKDLTLPASTSAALLTLLHQLADDATALSQSARDGRLAAGAQVARVQDLLAAVHTMAKAAARVTAALHQYQLDEPRVSAPDPEPAAPPSQLQALAPAT